MMRKIKSFISVMLTLTMALSMLCLPAFAETEAEVQAPDLSINAPAPKTIYDIVHEDGSPVKIACIGDSITYGYTIDEIDRNVYSYPAMLGAKLGEGYEVGNFGKSASYILPGDSEYNLRDDKKLSYRDTQQYADSIAFAPDVVIIMLGTNDLTSLVSPEAEAVIEQELENIITTYQSLESVDRVYVMTSIFAPYNVTTVKTSDGVLQKLQQRAAADTGAEFIDIYSLTCDYFDVMLHLSDRLHPDEDSYEAIPSACYALLTGTEYTPLVAPVAESGVVYVDASSGGKGSLANDGLTPETPVSSIALAAGMLRENGGTIVVCGNYSAYTQHGTHMPKTNGTITITSKYGDVDYRDSGAQLKMNNTYFYLGGNTVFEDINIYSSSNTVLVCNYNDMTIGHNVVCTNSSSATYPMILAGYNVTHSGMPAEMVSFYGNCNITINSGTFTYLRNGNRRGTSNAQIGTVAKGACVTSTINGGTFVQLDTNNNTSATGMNNVEGDCNLIINGGSFAGRIYGVARSGSLAEGFANPVCTGNVNVYLYDGMYAATIRGRQDNTVDHTNATVTLYASERYSTKSADFYGFDAINYVDKSTVITTPDALLELMNDSTKWNGHYVLGADIDLSKYEGELTQKPIGNYSVIFKGCFDGAGHEISGLDITAEGCVGLFGCVELSQIRNLTVKGAVKNTFAATSAETKYTADGSHHGVTGMIAGMVFAQSEIINCKAYGTTEGNGNVGGMIGMVKNYGNWTITVEYCDNYVVPTNVLGNTGGVIARITSNGIAKIGAKIIGCNNYADITSTSADRARMGGIIAYIRTELNNVLVENCVNYGNLCGTNSATDSMHRPYVGGICGRAEVTYPSSSDNAAQASSLTVKNCVNEGEITSSYMGGGIFAYFQRSSAITGDISFANCVNKNSVNSSNYAAGIVGYIQNENASNNANITCCVNYGDITSEGSSGAGGLVGRIRGTNISNCFSNGTIIGAKRTNLGALFGISASATSTATNCYAPASVDTKLVGKTSSSLVVTDCAFVDEANVAIKDSYVGFDFADTWIIKNGAPALDCFTTEATGDIDADGVVTNADITLAVRYLSKYKIDYRANRFDLTGDGKLTNRDVIALINLIAQ